MGASARGCEVMRSTPCWKERGEEQQKYQAGKAAHRPLKQSFNDVVQGIEDPEAGPDPRIRRSAEERSPGSRYTLGAFCPHFPLLVGQLVKNWSWCGPRSLSSVHGPEGGEARAALTPRQTAAAETEPQAQRTY